MRWLPRTCLACLLLLGYLPSSAHAESSSEGGHVLRAAAGSSPRPPECRSSGSGSILRGYTVWDRARRPRLVHYCHLLARGYARLADDPHQALTASKQAAELLPGRVSVRLLQARALLALNRVEEAFLQYREALTAQPELRLSPDGLHSFARAALASGHLREALVAYRRVVPMAG